MCGEEDLWEMGTILNIGARGCFHTYKHADKGTEVTIELRDLYDLPFEIKGRVAWTRTWRQSPKLPGFGIVFEVGPLEHGQCNHADCQRSYFSENNESCCGRSTGNRWDFRGLCDVSC